MSRREGRNRARMVGPATVDRPGKVQMATWRSTGVAAACAGSDGSSGSFVLHEVVSELRGSVRFDATVDP